MMKDWETITDWRHTSSKSMWDTWELEKLQIKFVV
jgi:hypothetical protein